MKTTYPIVRYRYSGDMHFMTVNSFDIDYEGNVVAGGELSHNQQGYIRYTEVGGTYDRWTFVVASSSSQGYVSQLALRNVNKAQYFADGKGPQDLVALFEDGTKVTLLRMSAVDGQIISYQDFIGQKTSPIQYDYTYFALFSIGKTNGQKELIKVDFTTNTFNSSQFDTGFGFMNTHALAFYNDIGSGVTTLVSAGVVKKPNGDIHQYFEYLKDDEGSFTWLQPAITSGLFYDAPERLIINSNYIVYGAGHKYQISDGSKAVNSGIWLYRFSNKDPEDHCKNLVYGYFSTSDYKILDMAFDDMSSKFIILLNRADTINGVTEVQIIKVNIPYTCDPTTLTYSISIDSVEVDSRYVKSPLYQTVSAGKLIKIDDFEANSYTYFAYYAGTQDKYNDGANLQQAMDVLTGTKSTFIMAIEKMQICFLYIYPNLPPASSPGTITKNEASLTKSDPVSDFGVTVQNQAIQISGSPTDLSFTPLDIDRTLRQSHNSHTFLGTNCVLITQTLYQLPSVIQDSSYVFEPDGTSVIAGVGSSNPTVLLSSFWKQFVNSQLTIQNGCLSPQNLYILAKTDITDVSFGISKTETPYLYGDYQLDFTTTPIPMDHYLHFKFDLQVMLDNGIVFSKPSNYIIINSCAYINYIGDTTISDHFFEIDLSAPTEFQINLGLQNKWNFEQFSTDPDCIQLSRQLEGDSLAATNNQFITIDQTYELIKAQTVNLDSTYDYKYKIKAVNNKGYSGVSSTYVIRIYNSCKGSSYHLQENGPFQVDVQIDSQTTTISGVPMFEIAYNPLHWLPVYPPCTIQEVNQINHYYMYFGSSEVVKVGQIYEPKVATSTDTITQYYFIFQVQYQTTQTFDSPLLAITQQQFDINIICGSEQILTLINNLQVNLVNEASQHIQNVFWIFGSNKAQCPVQQLKMYQQQSDISELSFSQIQWDNSDPTLRKNLVIDKSLSFQMSFWIKASTAGKDLFFPTMVAVCGGDPSVGGESLKYVGPQDFRLFVDMQSSFIFNQFESDKQLCPVTSYEILDVGQTVITSFPYQDILSFDQSLRQVGIDTSSLKQIEIFVRATTSGLIQLVQKFTVEIVCGSESIIEPANTNIIKFERKVSTGVHKLDLSEYLKQFISTNSKCPVERFKISALNGLPYSDPKNQMRISENFLELDTNVGLLDRVILEMQAEVPLSGKRSSQTQKVQILVYLAFLPLGEPPKFEENLPEFIEVYSGNPKPEKYCLPNFVQENNPKIEKVKFQDELNVMANYQKGCIEVQGNSKFLGNYTMTVYAANDYQKAEFQIMIQILEGQGNKSQAANSSLESSISNNTDQFNKYWYLNEENKSANKANGNNQVMMNNTYKLPANVTEYEPMSMEIVDLTNTGQLSIEFTPLFINREFTQINNSVLELSIIPYEAEGRNLSMLTFDWNSTSFNQSNLDIQLNFHNPLYVSFGGIDQIQVKVINQTFFERKQFREYIGQNYTLNKKIRTQMPNSKVIVTFKESTNSLRKGFDNAVIATIITNFFLAGSIQIIWSLINTLQLIMYLPMLSLSFPANAKFFYSIMLPLSNLELIPIEYSTELIFKISVDKDYPHSETLEEMGYETHNILLNFGSIFLYIAGNVILMLVVFVTPKTSKVHRYLRKLVIFNGILMVYFEAYLEVMISCYLSFENQLTENLSDYFGAMLAYISSFICIIILPILVLNIICRSEEYRKANKNRIGSLYQGLKDEGISLAYNLIYILRRAIFLFVVFNSAFQKVPYFQIMILLYFNLFCSEYVAYVRPYIKKLKNTIEVFNEYGIFAASVCLMTYTEWVPQPEDQTAVGWYMIGITLLIMFINLGNIFLHTVKEAIKRVKRKLRNRNKKAILITLKDTRINIKRRKLNKVGPNSIIPTTKKVKKKIVLNLSEIKEEEEVGYSQKSSTFEDKSSIIELELNEGQKQLKRRIQQSNIDDRIIELKKIRETALRDFTKPDANQEELIQKYQFLVNTSQLASLMSIYLDVQHGYDITINVKNFRDKIDKEIKSLKEEKKCLIPTEGLQIKTQRDAKMLIFENNTEE